MYSIKKPLRWHFGRFYKESTTAQDRAEFLWTIFHNIKEKAWIKKD